MEKLKRYLIFLIGLFINSLGVSLITKADLGTSPISSVPYVLSLNFPFTLGQFTIVFSLVLILIQFLILRKNFRLEHLLQIPVSVLFGYFIDLTMMMLFFVKPENYTGSLLYLLIGCVILGFGVYTEVLANVAMLPGESFVRAVSSTWKTEFGSTKVAFDVSLTVIAALLVGFIARLFGKKLSFLEPLLFVSARKKRIMPPHNSFFDFCIFHHHPLFVAKIKIQHSISKTAAPIQTAGAHVPANAAASSIISGTRYLRG